MNDKMIPGTTRLATNKGTIKKGTTAIMDKGRIVNKVSVKNTNISVWEKFITYYLFLAAAK